jgi:hypothetical protein
VKEVHHLPPLLVQTQHPAKILRWGLFECHLFLSNNISTFACH